MSGSGKKEAVDQSPKSSICETWGQRTIQPSFAKAKNIMPQRNGTKLWHKKHYQVNTVQISIYKRGRPRHLDFATSFPILQINFNKNRVWIMKMAWKAVQLYDSSNQCMIEEWIEESNRKTNQPVKHNLVIYDLTVIQGIKRLYEVCKKLEESFRSQQPQKPTQPSREAVPLHPPYKHILHPYRLQVQTSSWNSASRMLAVPWCPSNRPP